MNFRADLGFYNGVETFHNVVKVFHTIPFGYLGGRRPP